jgi:trehalose 6-phosphate phosphatase
MTEQHDAGGTPAQLPETIALFLDFDGTLVDIAERPEAIVVEPMLPGILARLRDRLDGALAVISGRPLAFLDERLGPQRFDAAGMHGLEYRLRGETKPCRPEDHPALRRAVPGLERALRPIGALLEDKGCSVAVHWRQVPEHADEAKRIAQAVATDLGAAYRIQWGKAVAEILPAAAGKGRVIERFLDEPPFRGRMPVFVGDDLTDEDGFRTVNARSGFSVRVGDGPTVARARIGTPARLRHCLSVWAQGAPFSLDQVSSG